MSNVDKLQGLQAPMGQFINVPRHPPADYRGVSAPNADTRYSLAWVDVSQPVVFSHPDMGKRFYLFEMTDLWMIDFHTPGTRTAEYCIAIRGGMRFWLYSENRGHLDTGRSLRSHVR